MNKNRQKLLADKIFNYLGLICTFLGLIIVTIFISKIFADGFFRLNYNFFSALPSRFPEKAGILTAWTGTLWILSLTTMISVPIGVSAGIYLEEYAKKGFLSHILEINIANLAAIPSIIYGILGLEIFVRVMKLGQSILAGSLTLSLLILPIIIVSTREALKSVPKSIKEASHALGASKWQTIRHQLLPAAAGNIITGIILAIARAVGETAPLIMIGALSYVPFVARSPLNEFTVLPIQIFNWVSRPQAGFAINAAAAIIVLLAIVFVMNGLAAFMRYKAQQKIRW